VRGVVSPPIGESLALNAFEGDLGAFGIVNLKGEYSVAWGVQGALSIVASLPTLFVFLFFQRYFIKGMTMGAVKG